MVINECNSEDLFKQNRTYLVRHKTHSRQTSLRQEHLVCNHAAEAYQTIIAIKLRIILKKSKGLMVTAVCFMTLQEV